MTNTSGDASHFFTCEIRNIKDPNSAGKCQVMIHGHHNIDDKPITDSDLPWAHSLMNNSPSLNGIGKSVDYLPGSTCIGFWLDPSTKQIPIILGSLHRSALPDYGS